jgi:hypothetical protein
MSQNTSFQAERSSSLFQPISDDERERPADDISQRNDAQRFTTSESAHQKRKKKTKKNKKKGNSLPSEENITAEASSATTQSSFDPAAATFEPKTYLSVPDFFAQPRIKTTTGEEEEEDVLPLYNLRESVVKNKDKDEDEGNDNAHYALSDKTGEYVTTRQESVSKSTETLIGETSPPPIGEGRLGSRGDNYGHGNDHSTGLNILFPKRADTPNERSTAPKEESNIYFSKRRAPLHLRSRNEAGLILPPPGFLTPPPQKPLPPLPTASSFTTPRPSAPSAADKPLKLPPTPKLQPAQLCPPSPRAAPLQIGQAFPVVPGLCSPYSLQLGFFAITWTSFSPQELAN